nr:arf-GAP domain and FG repeat-containing protein 1-like [Pocillopora verrucosa]
MMASAKKKQDEKNLKLLRDLAALPHNKKCFDCGQRGPTYVNTTIGSFVCTSCSGILRGLNPPYRVKSISMTSFTPQEIENLQGTGNEYCKKVWLGLWNSSAPAEPESRDEQKIKDFMVQKYERKRWYMPPQQATANNTSQSAPEPKPLKQLLGENTPPVTVQAQATRERPRTGSQTGASPTPVSVAPPPGTAQPAAQPAPQPAPPKPPSVDLLGDLGGDPFATPQPQGQFGSPPQAGGFGSFNAFGAPAAAPAQNAFGAPAAAPAQNSFDPFGSSAPQPAQQSQPSFAAFGAPPQQQQQPAPQPQQQTNLFDAFGSPPSSSGGGFNAFGAPPSSAPSQPQPTSNAGFGPLVSASGSTATQNTAGDKYAALSELDNLFGPSSGGSNTGLSTGTGFGSGGSSSFGMSSGPNPFSNTSTGSVSGGFQQPKQPQQQQQQPSNPFQGLGGGPAGFGQLNGPMNSMNQVSSMSATTGTGSVFGSQPSSGFGNQQSFSGNQPVNSGFGNQQSFSGSQPVNSGFGSQQSFGGSQPVSSGFGNQQSFSNTQSFTGGFGNLTTAPQQSSFGGNQQSGWGSMGGQQQMGGQNMGMPPTSTQQNLSFGGAGMTALASAQFGKMGGGLPQQPPVRGQMNFGGNQPGFGGSQGFGAGQPTSMFGGSAGGFGASSMSSGNSFGAQQQPSGFGAPGGFGAQPSGGFGNQGGAVFGGNMSGMGSSQFGQQQQMQQFGGGWQQSPQANPFMNAGAQQGMQRQGQSTNPFM